MRAINLLPSDGSRGGRRAPRAAVLVGVAGAVIVTLLLALGFLSASSKRRSEQQRLGDAQAQLRVLGPPPAANETANALAGEQQARIAAVSAALSRRVGWDRILRHFALVVPDDVWFTSVTAKAPVSASATTTSVPPAPNGPPTGFVATGYTYSHPSVARLLARLALVPDLVNVQLQQSVRTKIGVRSVVQFTVAADIRRGGSST
ncbi:MAG: PilN domain-containing protein [Actinomycetota bacterium]|nr:PilN domain-containing protein [Actinomycetota bacterium]